ncbi:hypothetical protein LSAT2_032269 [Lamellibrachia satsuma]|nr:hypothetical protein LSAT2_032269 [Lamellibrachia satsuma]
MTDALENHQGTVSMGGRKITNLRFVDDIDGLAGDEQELVNLVECLEKTSTSYGMEISAEKTKLMTNNTQGISTEVKVNGQRLETVTSFRYLGSIITDEGSKPEILARIAQTTAALTRLKHLWNDRNITVISKIRLMCSLVMSIFLYASETWTLSADLQKRIQAMEMRCFRKILRISYKDHVTNEAVHNKIKQAIGPYDDLFTTVKNGKLKWYSHVSRSSGLAKTILQDQKPRCGKTTHTTEPPADKRARENCQNTPVVVGIGAWRVKIAYACGKHATVPDDDPPLSPSARFKCCSKQSILYRFRLCHSCETAKFPFLLI